MDVVTPVYLFSDSQLLFWKNGIRPYLSSVLNFICAPEPCAAYIGASNGDRPEYFEIFRAAMENIGLGNCRKIRSRFDSDDRKHLAASDLILLAGGDPELGWGVFEAAGIKDAILASYRAGAVLIGVSAGAVHLGSAAVFGEQRKFVPMLQIVPFVIDVHQEEHDWRGLRAALRAGAGYGRGLAIPAGAGLVYHPDHSLQPLRGPITEYVVKDGRISSTLLCPDPADNCSGPDH